MRFHFSLVPVAVAALLSASAASAQVKIGFTGVLSGGEAAVGQDQIDGFMLGLEQLNGKLGGQAATVLREDDRLKPELGLQTVRKYIEKDKVNVILGLGFSNVLMASLKPIAESGVVAIATQAGPSPIAGAACSPNLFSLAWQNDGAAEAMGKFVQEKGYKKVYLLAPNFQAGKDMLAGFKRYYKGEIIDEVYTQIGQTDYSAEIAQLAGSQADAVFAFYPGGMGVNYIRQSSQAGLLKKLPNFSVFTVDGTTMPALGDAAVGTYSGAMWDVAVDNPENKKFVSAFEARYKRTPSEYAATGYDAARLLDVAVAKVGANLNDRKALAAAVKAAGQEFKSVRGPFRFNTNNLPIQNYYAFEVVKEGGKQAIKMLGTVLTEHKDAYSAKCGM
ncbi:amino acid/amide ABC transporter substrate-binding protein, HAAT family [Noviherbaspirillum humi]|uniref:Amino acid/amide ABC transporter substrate-binding protein, HAAT family n=1 Tax=Noviherbaspirillum humi TaxID=1688639 RepID=A0A239LKZ1_9BURK|nr:ABC transporter substrate-binding protein [Noviherbaspirillum humi]SNT31121.1 amino acid/amide ABC transporter substrate-binding protein, HAAT family [Noviherbaspirillum humi]